MTNHWLAWDTGACCTSLRMHAHYVPFESLLTIAAQWHLLLHQLSTLCQAAENRGRMINKGLPTTPGTPRVRVQVLWA